MKGKMRKLGLIVGVYVFLGMVGVNGAGAGECNGTENLWTEGIPYPCENDKPVAKTKLGALGCQHDMLTEGPSHNCGHTMHMIHASAGIVAVNDMWTEGPDYRHNEKAAVEQLRIEALKTLPAAGK